MIRPEIQKFLDLFKTKDLFKTWHSPEEAVVLIEKYTTYPRLGLHHIFLRTGKIELLLEEKSLTDPIWKMIEEQEKTRKALKQKELLSELTEYK